MYVLDVFRLAHQFRIGLGGNQRFKSRSIALLVDVLYAKLHIFILFLLLRLSLFQIRLRLGNLLLLVSHIFLQGIITYQKAHQLAVYICRLPLQFFLLRLQRLGILLWRSQNRRYN